MNDNSERLSLSLVSVQAQIVIVTNVVIVLVGSVNAHIVIVPNVVIVPKGRYSYRWQCGRALII